MTSCWLFPPHPRVVEFDEQWSFVGKKAKNCDREHADDARQGDGGDHLAFDPEHRLVVSLVCGRRTADLTFVLVVDFFERPGGRVMNLMMSDEYPTYASAIAEGYGDEVVPERTGPPGRPCGPYQEVPEEVTDATVPTERDNGRVVSVEERVVYGTAEAVATALESLDIGEKVNTAHQERFHGTDRNRNAPKVRKAYTFSTDWEVPVAVTRFVRYRDNFCWPVRTLRVRGTDGVWEQRTPAMSAGLTDHVWSLEEWLTHPSARKTINTIDGT